MAENLPEGLPENVQELIKSKPEVKPPETEPKVGETPPTITTGEEKRKEPTPLPLSKKQRAATRGLKSLLVIAAAVVALKGAQYFGGQWTKGVEEGIRERNATAAWTELLQYDIGPWTESVLKGHLTSDVDPDDYTKWTGRFGEEAKALIEVTEKALTPEGREELDRLGDKYGISLDDFKKYANEFEENSSRPMKWEDLRAYLKNELGIAEQYLKIIDELKKESSGSHNGRVRDALEGKLGISPDWRPVALAIPNLMKIQKNIEARRHFTERKIRRGRFRG